MRFFQFIGIILLSLVVGCSSKPSETEARQNLEQEIQKESDGLIKLVDFKKTNAVERQIQLSSETLYEMEWTATIELTCDCYWLPKHGTYMASTNPGRMWEDLFLEKGQKGERIAVNGKTMFEKAENGWRVYHGF